METTKEQILTDFKQVAHDTVAYYQDHPLPTDDVTRAWFSVCRRLKAMLESLPSTVSWENHVQILDMFIWIRPNVVEQMQEQDHPFYLAWLDVKEEHGL